MNTNQSKGFRVTYKQLSVKSDTGVLMCGGGGGGGGNVIGPAKSTGLLKGPVGTICVL